MFLKNKNIIFKITRSKVTDYAALTFFSENTGLIELQFHIKYLLDKLYRYDINFVIGHLTEMVTTPIYGKTKFI